VTVQRTGHPQGALLVVPQIGSRGLLPQLLQCAALGLDVKGTSGRRRDGRAGR
jgi:hypothetical protein